MRGAIEVLLDATAPGGTHARRARSGSASSLVELRRQLRGIARRDQHAGLAVGHDLGRAAVGEAEDGEVHRHRFGVDQPERLVGGRHGEHVGSGEQRRDVRPPPKEVDAIGNAEFLAPQPAAASYPGSQSGGSPTISSWTSGSSWETSAIARMRSPAPFDGNSRQTVTTTGALAGMPSSRRTSSRPCPGRPRLELDPVLDDVDPGRIVPPATSVLAT